MTDYCKYRDSCAGRERFQALGRDLGQLDKTLCSNTEPKCVYFHGYQRLNRNNDGIVINASPSSRL